MLNLEDIAPEDIQDDEALFVDGLGLDSIDALELGMAVQKNYNIKIQPKDENIKEHFFSINTLCDLINSQKK